MNDTYDDDLDPGQMARLRDAAARLPRDAEPPPDAWDAIRRRIEAQRVRPITDAALVAGPGAPGRTAPRRRRASWLAIAAAAVLVIAVLLPGTSRRGKARFVNPDAGVPVAVEPLPTVPGSPQGGTASRVVPAVPAGLTAANPTLAAVLDQYQQASRDLEAEVANRSTGLSPETREVVRRSLATIDSAVADLRAALGVDPRDAAVGRSLALVYERKLDFLRRVRALPAAGM